MVSSEYWKKGSREAFSAVGWGCLFMAFHLLFWDYRQHVLNLPLWHLEYFDCGLIWGFKSLSLNVHYLAILYLHSHMSVM